MYLLDTNVMSEIRKIKAGRAHSRVAAWVAAADPATLYLSVISVFEIEIGIERLNRHDKAQADLLRHWVYRQIIPTFGARILGVDLATAHCAAKLHSPDPRPFADSLIAATAQVRGFAIVTRNSFDFVDAGSRVINPWGTN